MGPPATECQNLGEAGSCTHSSGLAPKVDERESLISNGFWIKIEPLLSLIKAIKLKKFLLFD